MLDVTIAWVIGPRLFDAADLADLATTIDAEDGFDRADCPTVRNPTLLVAGGRDRFYETNLFAETAALIPGCRLTVYPRLGHVTVTTFAPAIAEVLGFLDAQG